MKINAYRSVNITDSFCNYLKKLKSEQDESRRLYSDGYKRNFVTDRLERNKENLMEITDFVNVKINGEMLSTNSIKFMSRIFKNELHIDFKFHNLRHSYATLLKNEGVSLEDVSTMLNHSGTDVTKKYYIKTDTSKVRKLKDSIQI